MSMLPGPDNPIAYAQFHLNGGWRVNGMIAGGFAVVLGFLVYVTHLGPDVVSSRRAVSEWATGLMVIQALVLLVFGSFRIESAVRGDVTGRMIESHRLMPTSAVGSIFGYLFVAPIQAIVLWATVTVVGLACCFYSGVEAGQYVLSSVLIALFALTVWSVVARFAFDSRGGFLIVLLGSGLVAVSQGAIPVMFPGIAVLTCPILGNPVFALSGRANYPIDAYSVSVLAQLAVTAVCVAAAARRFRSDDLVGFTPALGLMLVAVWTLSSVVGTVSDMPFLRTHFFYSARRSEPRPQGLVASITVGLLLATLPVSAAARTAATWRLRGKTAAMPRRPFSTAGAILLAAAITSAIMSVALCVATPLVEPERFAYRAGLSAGSILLFLAGAGALAEWLCLAGARPIVLGVVWLLGTWLIPTVAAAVGNATSGSDRFDPVMAGSPVGLIALAWTESSPRLMPGLIFQALVTAIPVSLLIARLARVRRALPSPE